MRRRTRALVYGRIAGVCAGVFSLVGCAGPQYSAEVQNATADTVSLALVSVGGPEPESLWEAQLGPGRFVGVGPEAVALDRRVQLEASVAGADPPVVSRRTLARGVTTLVVEPDGRGILLRVIEHRGSLGRVGISGELGD